MSIYNQLATWGSLGAWQTLIVVIIAIVVITLGALLAQRDLS